LKTFAALLNGAVILPFNLKKEGVNQLSKWLMEEEVTLCGIGATTFRHLVATLSGMEAFPKLRVMSFGGEPFYRRDVELCRKHFGSDCTLHHSLGATEASNCCTYFIDNHTRIDGNVVPCGYANTDVEILLLDDNGKQVGFNQLGEIAIKSRYVALGYWRRPELTQAKFLPDPDGGDKRIYLTGDLGRMLPDACLEHLGRKDFQVKIRGYSIAVREVEMALLALDTIKEAVVVAHEVWPDEKRLVAYIVPDKKPPPTVTTLRRALAETLPDYMLPSTFVILDAVPQTAHGKVDRRALPVPSSTRPQLDAPFVTPKTSVEKALAKIWAEVLCLSPVGVHDNFFDLGGNSLLASQVMSRTLDVLQVELPLRFLFETPTVAEMALVITQNQGKKAGQEEIGRMLAELESLSNEEAERLLSEQGESEQRRDPT
jgi:acyl-coenzyme A synthetase/AMP-(fatty) acid ligase